MSESFRFPYMPHACLGKNPPRGDKVLSVVEAREILAHDVVEPR